MLEFGVPSFRCMGKARWQYAGVLRYGTACSAADTDAFGRWLHARADESAELPVAAAWFTETARAGSAEGTVGPWVSPSADSAGIVRTHRR